MTPKARRIMHAGEEWVNQEHLDWLSSIVKIADEHGEGDWPTAAAIRAVLADRKRLEEENERLRAVVEAARDLTACRYKTANDGMDKLAKALAAVQETPAHLG